MWICFCLFSAVLSIRGVMTRGKGFLDCMAFFRFRSYFEVGALSWAVGIVGSSR